MLKISILGTVIFMSLVELFIFILLLVLIAVIIIKIALFSVHERDEKPISVEETEIQIEQ